MESVLTPKPAPAERERVWPNHKRRYDWDKVQVGTWQNWIDEIRGEDVDDIEAQRRAQNVIVAAREWARRRGLQVQTRRVRHGRILDLLFTPRES
jgi:hypothetical protein